MSVNKKRLIVIFITTLLLISIACDLSFGGSDESPDAEKTLEAIYLEQTVAAVEQQVDSDSPDSAETAPTATLEIKHSIKPGEPGWVSQWWVETDSSSTASQKRANGGDFLSQNLLERPFTSNEMDYRPDVDIVRVELSEDDTFYYFLLHMSGVNKDTDMLSAYYGVEIDLDRDSRGDVLLWAKGDGKKEWDITDVFVFEDSNDDVGGSRPLIAEAPDYDGDSFDKTLFSIENLSDPDAAWKRVDPSDKEVMQLAVKKSLLGNAKVFMWNGWADDGPKNTTQFDYNDIYTLEKAGSPLSGTNDYPLKELYLVDNTCRLPWGFEPTGNELNVCYVPEPEEPTEEAPPCDCDSYENYTFIEDQFCCEYCGFTWGGTQEFPCYVPGPEPPCNCGDYANQTEMLEEACCEYCGYDWTGDDEFPCE